MSSGTRCKTTCTTRNEKIAGSNQGPAITEIDSPAVRSGRRLIIEPIPSVSEPLPCDLAPWELAGTEQENFVGTWESGPGFSRGPCLYSDRCEVRPFSS